MTEDDEGMPARDFTWPSWPNVAGASTMFDHDDHVKSLAGMSAVPHLLLSRVVSWAAGM